MPNFKQIIVISCLLFFDLLLLSERSSGQNIDTLELKRHLQFISCDELQGRAFGTKKPGLEITAAYLAEQAKSIGLKPAFEDYFQKVPVYSTKTDLNNSFVELTDIAGKSVFRTDSVFLFSENLNTAILNTEIVFAGFGWLDEKKGYDDFKDLDINGKVVILCSGTPQSFLKKEKYRWNNILETEKCNRALKLGASGVILIISPLDINNETFGRIYRWTNREAFSLDKPESKDSGAFFIAPKTLADAVLGKGEYVKYLKRQAKNRKRLPVAQPALKINARGSKSIEIHNMKNVAGIIEGSHNERKQECIVFMAHFDHLGVSETGDVYNGADDNGSGIAVLLELAREFARPENKPQRSVLFLWVTGEEQGMLGSQYYCDNPVFSMKNTRACINLDMVGRVAEPRDSVSKNSPKKVKDFDGIYALTNSVWPELTEISDSICNVLKLNPDKTLPDYFLRSSDHYSFHEKGVPVINYSTGYHADYHRPGDEIQKINFQKMKRVAELCFRLGMELANEME